VSMDMVFLSGQFTVAIICDNVQRWPAAPTFYLLQAYFNLTSFPSLRHPRNLRVDIR
jgi:hypothetical protein